MYNFLVVYIPGPDNCVADFSESILVQEDGEITEEEDNIKSRHLKKQKL